MNHPLIPDVVTVPFINADVYLGLAAMSGIIKASRDGLVLEYDIRENLSGSGLMKSPVKVLELPLGELDNVSLKQSLIGASLFIRVKSLALLQDIPGSQQGQLTLGIERKDREAAQRLVSTVTVLLSENTLEQFEARREPPALT